MNLSLHPMRVATEPDRPGMLVLVDGVLLAVLVQLSDNNEVAPSEWYLEAGFGPNLDGPDHPTFETLEEAQTWIEGQLAQT
jgi:hypothetical protein